MTGENLLSLLPSTQEIVAALEGTEKLYMSDLSLVLKRGEVGHIRDASLSLVMIKALQTSLGNGGNGSCGLAISLLGLFR